MERRTTDREALALVLGQYRGAAEGGCDTDEESQGIAVPTLNAEERIVQDTIDPLYATLRQFAGARELHEDITPRESDSILDDWEAK